MGERLKHTNKHLICSFADCKATFSKLWKLEVHYCRHTGLVSNRNQLCNLVWVFDTEVLFILVLSVWLLFFIYLSEALCLWRLREELLHPLPAHPTSTEPQRGETLPVSPHTNYLFTWTCIWYDAYELFYWFIYIAYFTVFCVEFITFFQV